MRWRKELPCCSTKSQNTVFDTSRFIAHKIECIYFILLFDFLGQELTKRLGFTSNNLLVVIRNDIHQTL